MTAPTRFAQSALADRVAVRHTGRGNRRRRRLSPLERCGLSRLGEGNAVPCRLRGYHGRFGGLGGRSARRRCGDGGRGSRGRRCGRAEGLRSRKLGVSGHEEESASGEAHAGDTEGRPAESLASRIGKEAAHALQHVASPFSKSVRQAILSGSFSAGTRRRLRFTGSSKNLGEE